MDGYDRSEALAAGSRDEALVADFVRGVYGWMCGGLAITAATAWVVANSPSVVSAIVTNRLLFWAIIIAQFGIVITLSARVSRLAASTASALFIAYSALTGVTLSFVLLLYTTESVASTFIICSGMFGALALYGTFTKRNLSGFGQFMFMGLIGLVLASLVGMFWQNDGLQFMISFIGVIVFAGLTVWDAQRLKGLAFATNAGGVGAVTIVGALALYLDFVNLFLFLLRFLGGRRR
ncbi:MAG TPA: Bax inhibitor-1/YccA family protein [Vicinamibacterales bacterium]|nr:Bax inhibitor-1/YccA family protein [Vicinamibacterales bacterium]